MVGGEKEMSRIKLPFKDRFFVPIQIGQKTMTTRSRRYGKAGDTFMIGNTKLEIVDVWKDRLLTVKVILGCMNLRLLGIK